MEAINRICVRILDDHVWISEFNLMVQENKILELLGRDIEVLCVLQWCLLWFSVPIALTVTMRKSHSLLDSYNEVLNETLRSAIFSPFRRTWTPTDCVFETTIFHKIITDLTRCSLIVFELI